MPRLGDFALIIAGCMAGRGAIHLAQCERSVLNNIFQFNNFRAEEDASRETQARSSHQPGGKGGAYRAD
jgi:hypothetical protein